MVDIKKFITQIQYDRAVLGKEVLEGYLNKYSQINTLYSSGPAVPFLLNMTNHAYPFFCEASERILGIPASDFMTKGLRAFIMRVHPDDLNIFHYRIVPDFRRVRVTRSVKQVNKLRYTFDFRFKNGSDHYIHCLQQMIFLEVDNNKNPLLCFGTVTDISDFKRENIIIGTMSLLNDKNEYETIYSKNYSSEISMLYSNREMDVIRLLAKGLSSKEIAIKLNISSQTVDKHRRNMLQKAQMKNTQELVVEAIRQGWL
jgi:DNA-binding CsgD family transcriptional regulator